MIKEIRETVEDKKHGKVTHIFKIDSQGNIIDHNEIYHEPQFTSLELDRIYTECSV